MLQPLTTGEYRFYFALCQGYPATLNDLTERLGKDPFGHPLTAIGAASLANRLVEKGYIRREKISAGLRGQPASLFAPVVALEQVVAAEARRALQQLAWDDARALAIIRGVVDEALEAATSSRRPVGRAKKAVKKPGARSS